MLTGLLILNAVLAGVVILAVMRGRTSRPSPNGREATPPYFREQRAGERERGMDGWDMDGWEAVRDPDTGFPIPDHFRPRR